MDIMSFNKSKKEEMIFTLYGLIDNWENEVIEFKEAGKDYDRDKIGRYFSALSNEANLRGLQHGWLIFGVNNKDRKIVGTSYRNSKGLDTLKHEIGSGVTGGMSFIDIYEIFPIVDGEEKRVVMFQIPAAITAIPTGWQNQEYARDGESLVPLSEEKRERIRRQVRLDWSKRFVANATMEHLNKEAIAVAREKYKEKMDDSHISAEVNKMSNEEFLERRKLVIDGKITNAAMLYGKEINEQFTYLLHDNEDLNLVTVFLLDQVQKGKPISKEAASHLRKHKLVEGRINNLYLAAPLAKTAEDKVQYIKNRGFDNKYYQDMIVDYLREFGKSNLAAMRDLLIDKFPNTLSPGQKERKVLTLLTALKRKGIITTDSDNKKISNWILVHGNEIE